jgi:hypothetical protein
MNDVIAAQQELGEESLDCTSSHCVASLHLSSMSEESRSNVATKLNKTVKSARNNKAVKQAVLEEEEYTSTTKVVTCTVAHLNKRRQATVSTIVHARRKTLFEEESINAIVKVGDWVQIETHYTCGTYSEGGLSSCPLVSARTIVEEVDVHYLILRGKNAL